MADEYLAHIQDENNPERPLDQENPPQWLAAIKAAFGNQTASLINVHDSLLELQKLQKEIQRIRGVPRRRTGGFSTSRKTVPRGEEALREPNIEDFRWHDLRHTFCSRLSQAGKDFKVIQEAAGHKTIATTAKYAHLNQTTLRSAMAVLNSRQ